MHQLTSTQSSLQWMFLAFAALIVLYQMATGWKRGVARQFVHLIALGVSYLAAWYWASPFVPMLRSLGYPDLLLTLIAGAGMALAVFIMITLAGMILFKKTSQQKSAIARFGYGMGGALLATATGLVLVLLAVIAVRVVGTVAESVIAANRAEIAQHAKEEDGVTVKPPNPMVMVLADLKQSLENGPAGGLLQSADPMPGKAYEMLNKITTIVATPENAKRFLDYPGAQAVISAPKFVALRSDPDIMKEIKDKHYLALMKNQHLVSAVNDPAFLLLLKKFDVEKALDYSLNSDQKGVPPANP